MPADYIAVRNSCYEKKRKEKGTLSDKDKKACQKMAAIWYFKKHGKPLPKEGEYMENLEESAIDETLSFNAPLAKESANYLSGKEIEENMDHEDEHFYNRCGNCVHFVWAFSAESPGMSPYQGVCHVVAGLIEPSASCDHYAVALVNMKEQEEVEDTEDSDATHHDKKKRKKKKKDYKAKSDVQIVDHAEHYEVDGFEIMQITEGEHCDFYISYNDQEIVDFDELPDEVQDFIFKLSKKGGS